MRKLFNQLLNFFDKKRYFYIVYCFTGDVLRRNGGKIKGTIHGSIMLTNDKGQYPSQSYILSYINQTHKDDGMLTPVILSVVEFACRRDYNEFLGK